jgi:hypothetical protein
MRVLEKRASIAVKSSVKKRADLRPFSIARITGVSSKRVQLKLRML